MGSGLAWPLAARPGEPLTTCLIHLASRRAAVLSMGKCPSPARGRQGGPGAGAARAVKCVQDFEMKDLHVCGRECGLCRQASGIGGRALGTSPGRAELASARRSQGRPARRAGSRELRPLAYPPGASPSQSAAPGRALYPRWGRMEASVTAGALQGPWPRWGRNACPCAAGRGGAGLSARSLKDAARSSRGGSEAGQTPRGGRSGPWWGLGGALVGPCAAAVAAARLGGGQSDDPARSGPTYFHTSGQRVASHGLAHRPANGLHCRLPAPLPA